ncbi:MAG: Ig-like domain-containing protein, partial [Promethearchaeota archaeon]
MSSYSSNNIYANILNDINDNRLVEDTSPKASAPPTVAITSPMGGAYFDATAPDFIVEISDAVNPIDTMWYTIDGGTTNITFTTNGTIDQNNWTALADGPVTLTFYANNSISEVDFASVSINKDTG